MTRIVYILAASHSGSTLLAMLLGRHPELCTVGELKATALGDVNEYRCSCGERILACSFWTRVSAEMQRRGIDYQVSRAGTDFRTDMSPYVLKLLGPLHRGRAMEALRDAALSLSPVWRQRLPEIQTRNAALAASVLKLTGKKALVDSSKIGIRLKYLLRTPGLDVKVVRLVRDGRGVALTYTDPGEFADARDPSLKCGGTGRPHTFQLPLAQAARTWRRSNEEASAIIRQLPPDRSIEIRYEQLCAFPERSLRHVFEFIGVDPDTVALDFRSTEHHVVGNGMRLDSAAAIQLDERWRTVLTRTDLSTFDAVAGVLNRQLGYL